MSPNSSTTHHAVGAEANGQTTVSLDALIKTVLENAVLDYDDKFGFGSMTCAAYDTAWVSLVTKSVGGKRQWLFPQCFDYLLDKQAEDGSWGVTGEEIDGILNTAAALLSCIRHKAESSCFENINAQDLNARIGRGIDSLRSQLRDWTVASTVHVGFEVIVPALLDLLAQESLVFSFDGMGELMKIREKKLFKFHPDLLYGPTRSTVIHSLEAFTGKIDLDRVSHHKTFGSMMGSPSSTAAYLMNATTWDDEAEEYLRHVVEHAAGKGSGGIPSAYPSTIFEYGWVLSTLFTSGISPADLEGPGLRKMTGILSQTFEKQGGTVGFVPCFLADLDDTAKTIVCLTSLGMNAGPRRMIEAFEGKAHFRTYPEERDPSFSANCNALLALLNQGVAHEYSEQINKISRFLCDTWWNSMSRIQDKWNRSHLYPTLLFVEAIVKLVALVEQGAISCFDDYVMKSKIDVCLYQACYRTLLDQEHNGMWNDSVEETSYATLILSKARGLYMFRDLRTRLESAIDDAAKSIQDAGSNASRGVAQHLWIEKVSYTSPLVTEIYRLAALRASTVRSDSDVGRSLHGDIDNVPDLASLWLRTPLFSNTPEWQIRASMVEGILFRPIVKAVRLDVFHRKGVDVDKYFDVIPLAWPIANNRVRTFAPSSFLLEGMMAAMLNYQVDEFMEAVAGVNYAQHIPELRRLIDEVIFSISKESEACANGTSNAPTNGSDVTTPVNGHHPDIEESKRDEVLQPLRKFVTRALMHPSILSASAWDRKNMTCELRIYLQTHVTQSEDNMLLQQNKFTDGIMRENFFRWVRTTSADHTSAPYTFNFVSCLLSSWIEKGNDCFPSTQEKYYAAAACQHLATMCRMYNDHGSAARDLDEANVNSIDFPEFTLNEQFPQGVDIATKKEKLFEVAQYERACIEEAFRRLESHGSQSSSAEARARKSRQMEIWRLFYNVTDFWGQMYVLRDMGSRLTVTSKA
ncbi:ent-kaurene synthase [Diaporthe helianthi]|uniref:Ent-kaurene synthase n=1 Tax=Diaporthe helianthi TaxID=158607 RepID=A0A2P5HK03_DIAHE|nr:ent-kaurene synthase [Diaporthe helianthi]